MCWWVTWKDWSGWAPRWDYWKAGSGEWHGQVAGSAADRIRGGKLLWLVALLEGAQRTPGVAWGASQVSMREDTQQCKSPRKVAAESSGLGVFCCGVIVGMLVTILITVMFEKLSKRSQRSILTQSSVTYRRNWNVPRMGARPESQHGAFAHAL